VALVNLMVAVVQRMHRFEDPFSRHGRIAILKNHPGQRVPAALAQGGWGAIGDRCGKSYKPLANPIAPTASRRKASAT